MGVIKYAMWRVSCDDLLCDVMSPAAFTQKDAASTALREGWQHAGTAVWLCPKHAAPVQEVDR